MVDGQFGFIPLRSTQVYISFRIGKKNNLAKDTGSKMQTMMQRKITFKQPVMRICTVKRTMYPHFSYPPVSNEILHLRPFCPKGACYHHPFNVGWIQVGEKGAIRKVLHFLICWAKAPPEKDSGKTWPIHAHCESLHVKM